MKEADLNLRAELQNSLEKARNRRLQATFLTGSLYYFYINYALPAVLKVASEARDMDLDLKSAAVAAAISIPTALSQEWVKKQAVKIQTIKESINLFDQEEEITRIRFR